jgi:nucleoside-diphosphate kinase
LRIVPDWTLEQPRGFLLLQRCAARATGQGALRAVRDEVLYTGEAGKTRSQKSINEGEDTLSQRTFSIVKPDAVRKGYTAAILAEIEKAGFKIVSIKRTSISKAQAEGFYYVHAARPFFPELTAFMSSGPIFPMVLEKENAIADLRKLMGATNPAQAEEGTIRKKFAASISENAIHGSDAEETAAFETGYFFAGIELQ